MTSKQKAEATRGLTLLVDAKTKLLNLAADKVRADPTGVDAMLLVDLASDVGVALALLRGAL